MTTQAQLSAEAHKGVIRKRWTSLNWRAYAMILPSLIIFLLFYIVPIFYLIYLSFHDWDFVNPVKQWIGLKNYQELLQDADFLQVLKNTFFYTFLSVSLLITLSLLISLWLNKEDILTRFVQGAIFSPYIISLVSVSMLWLWLMDPQYGLLNAILSWFGLPPYPWLDSPDTALYSLVLVSVWQGLGYNTLVFIAGLKSIPPELYEAAALDDTPRWKIFLNITIPMLSPTLFFLIIIDLIASFKVFETIAIMTGGGPLNSTNMLVYYIYEYGFRFYKIGYASAAAVILLIILSVLTWIYFALLEKRVHYR
ncbi:MAG: sugar ABC transporter permease [Candidatus Carbobacillus altaicus]|uniref:N-Acetyl-D-glucosamine ABC transport system, permease protein 1 n=1 Tax=Candidatus Carbonibacillus altaicus TaxID=2163959 RepID=A0A2R6XXM8_9BACL|nr:sugar ABC transporter permease [Candidatus Carbobacillus altaicus]PTQ55176.1 MAG: N-Acetyl-D-glucosamine ABC transport system, permease protein 1 [Candidatus Carbobacillus altaicus]